MTCELTITTNVTEILQERSLGSLEIVLVDGNIFMIFLGCSRRDLKCFILFILSDNLSKKTLKW